MSPSKGITHLLNSSPSIPYFLEIYIMRIEHVNNIIDDCQDGYQVVEKLSKTMTPQLVHDAILDIKLNGTRYSKIKIIKLDTALTIIRNKI